MEGWCVLLVTVSAVVCLSHDRVYGSMMEMTVTEGVNITLYCDCKFSVGVYIVWYRDCSHEYQPSLFLHTHKKSPPGFHFVKNWSSESYDLLILNISQSDEGLYYCGTQQTKVVQEEQLHSKEIFSYGNITTRIIVRSVSDLHQDLPDRASSEPTVSWMLTFSPAITILSSFICFILVYHVFQRTETQTIEGRTDTGVISSQNQDENECLTRVIFLLQDRQTLQ